MIGRDPTCPACGGELEWLIEYTAAAPHGSGWEIQVCSDCGFVYARRYVGR